MADVFSTEDYDDWENENNESDLSVSSTEIKVVVEEPPEPQKLLNNNSEDLNEDAKDNSDMTLKEGASEPELFAPEDLLVNPDDLLPPVVKLEKYANSDIVFNRQVVARNLLETLRLVHGNKDDVSRVINVLCSISEDYDPSVRTELMVQLPHLAGLCKELKLNNTIVQYLVPMLISYLGDENNQVRKSSHSALLSLIEQGLLDFDTISEKVCPLILHLTDNIHPEDLRTESVVLMSKLVILMGKKAAEDIFFERLFALCGDKSNNVRKACASTFGDLCTTVGRESTEEILLPKFFSLCEDTAWCVRKACAENFMPVSCVVSRGTRCKELSNLYMILLSDQSRWVRLTAYQALGPFISTFAEPDRTGLYYSKDGILTIVDAAPSYPVQNSSQEERDGVSEVICNGEVEESVSEDSSLDDANSSKPCDSVVPLCSSDTNHSASDIPGISCHVGNYCTVIEVSSPAMTSPAGSTDRSPAVVEEDSSEDSCDSKDPTDGLNSGDSWTTSERVQLQLDGSASDKEKEFNKLWFEAVYGSVDGAANGAPNCDENCDGDLDAESRTGSDWIRNIGKSEEKSALLSSITVNGVNISTSVALSGPLSCEAIPLISCSNSIKNDLGGCEDSTSCSPKVKEQSFQNSTYESCDDSNISCDVIPSLVFSAQEFNCAPKESLAIESHESIQLKISDNDSSDNESAFNYFQYWRDPLPDIDVSDVVCLNDSNTQVKECHGNQTCKWRRRKDVYNYDDLENHSWEWSEWAKSIDAEIEKQYDDKTKISRKRNSVKDLKSVLKEKGEPPPDTKLLSAHDQDIVPPELLTQYLSMIDAAWAQTVDAEIARHCAYSLPAVALTLGRQFWPCLKDTFDALSSDLQGFIMMWKVRRTVASAMHQLAVILGPDITSRDLLPVFSRFIDDLDEVRVGILQHLYEFLKVLRSEERKQFLPSLPKFLVANGDSDSNEKNWRFRLILAEQLVLVADLYEPQQVRDHLVPLSLTLIKDKVCEVRLSAVRVMAAVMRRLSQDVTTVYTKAVLSELTEKFVHSPKWLHRQLYVYVCQQIILEKSLSPDQFAEDALPQLLYLCWDRVPNVRIAIARCLVVVLWPIEIFSSPESPHRELLLQTIHTLQSDMDADVRFYANMVSTHECSCLQNGEYTNVSPLFDVQLAQQPYLVIF